MVFGRRGIAPPFAVGVSDRRSGRLGYDNFLFSHGVSFTGSYSCSSFSS